MKAHGGGGKAPRIMRPRLYTELGSQVTCAMPFVCSGITSRFRSHFAFGASAWACVVNAVSCYITAATTAAATTTTTTTATTTTWNKEIRLCGISLVNIS
jgi:hypothetical protein